MPYEDEHSCRLKDPNNYDEFRRVDNDIEIGDKTADAIYGVVDGSTELQSVRFPKNKFEVSEAKSWCKDHDGLKFEPAVEEEVDNMEELEDDIEEVKNKAVPNHRPDILDDESWDGDSAVQDLRAWASNDGSGDKDTINWGEYRDGFGWYDDNDPENFGSYKLPHHKVVDGELRTSKRGVYAAGAAVSGARGGVDISDSQLADIRDHLETHYSQMDEDAPWEESDEEEQVYECECIECGLVIETGEHCRDIKCPDCGGEMRRVDRPGAGYQDDNTEEEEVEEKKEYEDKKFNILKHWWKGELTFKDIDEMKHFDFIIDGKQFVFKENPIENDEIECSVREPYSKDFIDKGIDGHELLNNRQPGTLGRERPCWIKSLANGEVNYLEYDDCIKIDFSKECLNEVWNIKLLNKEKNIWLLEKTKKVIQNHDVEYVENLKNFELQQDPIDIQLMEEDSDGNLIIEGNIISNGTWNGLYFTEESIKSIDESTIENLKIDVGKDHRDKMESVGEVIKYEWNDQDNAWWIRAKITDSEAVELAQELENAGFSIEVIVMVDEVKKMIEEINELECVVLVENPACQVCYVD